MANLYMTRTLTIVLKESVAGRLNWIITLFIQDSGTMCTRGMDRERRYGTMGLSMKGIGGMIRLMGREGLYMLTGMYI